MHGKTLQINPLDELRARRVKQIAVLFASASLITLPIYLWQGNWETATPIIGCIALMAVVYRMASVAEYAHSASTILVASLAVVAAALQWLDHGMRDVSITTFAGVLVLAGYLLEVRKFFVLLMLMVSFWIFETWATEVLNIRHNKVQFDPFDQLRDAILILLMTGWCIWFFVMDLAHALADLGDQVNKYKQVQKKILHVSRHDPLTELPNRLLEIQLVEQMLARAKRNGSRLAMLFVDLDNFKAINDSFGHATGDEHLKIVAQRLKSAVRMSDVVARHGGDEFIICLEDVSEDFDISSVATTVLTALSKPIQIGLNEFEATCSVGISVFPEDASDFETLIKHSDIAMYKAKEAGRNTYRFFDGAMEADIEASLLLVSGLRLALKNREFVLYYQPIINLATKKMVGCEALIRWQHPERGLVPPMEFIPVAEKSGLIVEIGSWVLRQACTDMAHLHHISKSQPFVAVNLSPVQFKRGDLEEMVRSVLADTGLEPSCLELEITESTLVQDNNSFNDLLARLKVLGVRFSIDDFGTGYSNLAYLQKFEVNKLKIDRSFVIQLLKGQQDKSIVTAIIQIAKSLNLTTTAEGIEDELTSDLLRVVDCDQGQGYLFSRPVTLDEITTIFLQQETGS